MDIIQTFSITEENERLSQVEKLLAAASQYDPYPFSFPFEEGMACWMAFEGNMLCAVFSLLPADDNLFECRALTHPSYRKKGLFRLLLSNAVKAVEAGSPYAELCFPVNPLQTEAVSVLNHLEAEYWYSEYMMECPLTSSCKLSSELMPELRFEPAGADIGGGWICQAWNSGLLTGTCRLLPHGSKAYLCMVEVPKPLRGQGLGTALIRSLLSVLYQQQVPSAVLQVSETNTAAVALYKKTGFQITETLSYYLY